MFRPSTSSASRNEAKRNAGKSKKIIKLQKKFGSSMGPVLVNQMQIVSVILSNIKWHPDVPQWLVDILVTLGNVFAIDLSTMVSSPDCVASIDPLQKWLLAVALPWCLFSLFFLWYGLARCYFCKTKKYDEDVVETVLQSAVQVLLIGLYTTVVKTCFLIFDCNSKNRLIMDSSYLCSDIRGHQAIGLICFILWAVVPFSVIGIQLARYKDKGLATKMNDSPRFKILYGWAIFKYKEDTSVAYLWELVNAAIKIIMTVGAVVMYDEKLKILHGATLFVSLLLHLKVQPYKDQDGNIVVLIFCIVDLIGVFSTQSVGFQMIYITATFLVLVVSLFLGLKSMRDSIQRKRMTGLLGHENKLTPLEKKLLCPLLMFVWPIKKVMKLIWPATKNIDVAKTREEEMINLRTWGVESKEQGNKMEKEQKEMNLKEQGKKMKKKEKETSCSNQNSGNNDTWNCSACSMENRSMDLKCSICSSPKPFKQPPSSQENNGGGGVSGGAGDAGGDPGGDGNGSGSVKKKKHHHHHHHHKSKKDKTKVVPI